MLTLKRIDWIYCSTCGWVEIISGTIYSLLELILFWIYFFSVRLLSVLRGHSLFHPHHDGQWPQNSKDFYTRSYPLYYFLIFILEKEPVFKQGYYWYHVYNVFGMTRSLTGDWTRDLPHSKPALYNWAIEEAVVLLDIQAEMSINERMASQTSQFSDMMYLLMLICGH